MDKIHTIRSKRFALLFTALMLPVISGCLAAAVGAGAAGVAGYFYYKGGICQEYPAEFVETWGALKASLGDSGFPVVSEAPGQNKGTLVSQTGDGSKITIDVETLVARVPAEGSVTRVCVRVGVFGDEAVSQRILDGIGFRLLGPPVGAKQRPAGARITPTPAPPPPPPPASRRGSRGLQETAEPPPLAPSAK